MKPVGKIVFLLRKKYPGLMHHKKHHPFKVLIFTVLSQRTRDENTIRASNALFSKYRNAKQIANARLSAIEKLIRPSGFYKVKARRVKEISRIIAKKGKVPCTMDELVAIPGVGRKTAGCVLVYGFHEPAIPVDTHVHRISNRIGIVKTKVPKKTEQELMRIVPKKLWIDVNELLVQHGQQVCRPITPKCSECPLTRYCDYKKSSSPF